MTKEEAQLFKQRFLAANAVEIAELRSMSIDSKLEQAAALMASAKQMGWEERLVEGEAEVRSRWVRLKKAYKSD
ncbi:MAG TPA: hypothetical protein VKA70_06600 [Blastocatellia bacterium]|nr:hypothetical protein [Blastocatellia bacterium]